MRRPHLLSVITCTLAMLLGTSAQAVQPNFSDIRPNGAQRGKTVEVELLGSRLKDAQELLLHDVGLKIKSFKVEADNKIKVSLEISGNCRLGEHRMRVRTATGISHLRTFFVGALPVVSEEDKDNNSTKAAQEVSFNCTIQGVSQKEDIDYYKMKVKKGQPISVEVEAIRLGRTLFDPHVALLDSNGRELASCDDSPLLRQDAWLSFVAPADGTYYVTVRDSAYGGSSSFRYRMHVGSFPRPSAVFPAGGKPGESFNVQWLGNASGPFGQKLTLPKRTGLVPVYPIRSGQPAPSPNWAWVTQATPTREAEPNNDRAKASKGAAVPVAFDGIINTPGDVDWYSFQAKKGQAVQISVHARMIRSPLDPVLNLYDAKGKNIKGSDDTGGRLDSYIQQTLPVDGTYYLRVRDHLKRGGPDYVYRIAVEARARSMKLKIAHVDRYDSQSRQWAAIPRGGRFMIMLNASRENFGDDIGFLCNNMPPGVKLHAPKMLKNVTSIPLVFEATGDAPIGGRLCELRGQTINHKPQVAGRFTQSVELVQGNPNRTPYYTTTVDQFTIAVTEAAPYSIRIEQPKTGIYRSGPMNLKIIAERKKGFDGEIVLQLPFRSPGINASSEIKIPKGKTEATYPINANGSAATGPWPFVINAWATVNSGRLYTSSPVTMINIEPHLMGGSIEMVALVQGESTEVVVKLNKGSGFAGEGTLELFGLPNQVTAKPQKVTQDTKEVIFPLTTTAKSPTGTHKSMFCRLTINKNGGKPSHSLAGGGVLRIDRPKPNVAAKSKPKPKAKGPKPPRRLTRLEKLRLEQAQRLKNAAAGAQP